MSTKKPAAQAPAKKKRGKLRLVILSIVGATALLGGGLGAGLYASGALMSTGEPEDSNRPKLVERGETEPASSSEGSEGDAPQHKVGTVSVSSDKVAVDPERFDVTYIPLDQPFTANLANGGIIQVGLSVATYYDYRVVDNVRRQTVPIRSAALLALSQEDPDVLSTPAGKAALQRSLTNAVNQVLRDKEGFGGIDNVYFTSLVIQ
jgi:flagellar protein FliL